MATYKKLIIQQQTYDGSQYTNVGSAIDTYATYKVACQEFPFKLFPESKEQPKRDWFDEDGEDVYISSEGIKVKAYDIEVKFLYVGKEADMATDLKNFINFLYGRTANGSSLLAIYDEYTQTGRRGMYVLSHSNDLFFYNDSSAEAIASFKVKFRVTDPVTDVTLTV